MTKNCILYDCFNAIDDHYQTLICTLIDSRKSILVNSLSFNLLMRGFFANEAYYRYLFHHSYIRGNTKSKTNNPYNIDIQ